MIGQPQSHRGRAVMIAMNATIGNRQLQGPMSPLEGVIEELQAHQRVPSGIAFGEGVRLAGEGIEPITQDAALVVRYAPSRLAPGSLPARRGSPLRGVVHAHRDV
jgi:hypothetical protein